MLRNLSLWALESVLSIYRGLVRGHFLVKGETEDFRDSSDSTHGMAEVAAGKRVLACDP